MTHILKSRMSAQIEGDFVVFLIGMRINAWWKVHKWLPQALSMPAMIHELENLPREQTGFLGCGPQGVRLSVQYWRSFDHLEAYARSKDHKHFPVWTRFNKRMQDSRGDVGIWHETYLISAGQYETLYSGMPATGLGKVSALVPAKGSMAQARTRLKLDSTS